MSYEVFTRNWWRMENGRKVPNPGACKTHLDYVDTQEEARALCAEYNEENDPGVLSRKAEYESY